MARWLPTEYTAPLSEQFTSDGDRLLRVIDRYWSSPETDHFELDDWQRWLIRAVLETYPPGHPLAGKLRYRQVVVSLGRQNGKSILGAILGFYGLIMHTKGPLVIGLASSAIQANIIYDRVSYVIRNADALDKLCKATGTRGITKRDGTGKYEIRASKGDALQGLPISLGLIDELHITKPEVWQAVVNGQRTRSNGLLIGITTAGDDNSELLIDLYKQGKAAVAGESERFGFFLWEAPEGATVADAGAIESANPAVACGRVPLDRVLTDVAGLPEADQQRYTLNRFIASTGSWLPMSAWHACNGAELNADGPTAGKGHLVWGIDRSEGWGYASVAASQKVNGIVRTEVVASILKPSLEQLLQVCLDLRRHGRATYVLDSHMLKDLGKELSQRGLEVHSLSSMEVAEACETTYALVVKHLMTHANDALLNQQVPRGVRKNIGDSWAISRQKSSVEIDTLMSTIFSSYVASKQNEQVIPIY